MKTLFVIGIENAVDIITNSSSELFVLKSENKTMAIDMVKEIYPDYLNEYEEIKSTEELSEEELFTYLDYSYRYPNCLDGFSLDEMYEKSSYGYWNLKNDLNVEKAKSALNKNMFFLFSLDDNPNWDMQEKLEEIAIRYHLG